MRESCDNMLNSYYEDRWERLFPKPQSYEDFIASLEFVNGRARVSIASMSYVSGGSSTGMFIADPVNLATHRERMLKEGYKFQTINTSDNVFRDTWVEYIYQPNKELKMLKDRHGYLLPPACTLLFIITLIIMVVNYD